MRYQVLFIGDAAAGFGSRQVKACALFAFYRLKEMPMIVMPGNNASGYVHYWAGRQLQQLVGHLWSPGRPINDYPWISYVLDNGKFAATVAQRNWSADDFLEHCARAVRLPRRPEWIVVPDQPKAR